MSTGSVRWASEQVLTGSTCPAQQTGRRACSPYGILYASDATQITQAFGQQENIFEIIVDTIRFVREAAFEHGDQGFTAFGEVEALLADEDVIVALGVEFHKGQVFGDAQSLVDAAQRPARLDSADVVHAGAELVALQGEGMRPAAGDFVLLADEHFQPGLGERHGGGQPACAGADDDGVVVCHGDFLSLNRYTRTGHLGRKEREDFLDTDFTELHGF